ncbi:phage tail tape measure protein [Virgibacillus pantothenticus]|uniref:phage tail tape measure protein n=1 Tax=Virgibacillus pantothenticus TaxID=1473 RepID=UPI000986657F|nr:phage tail tape measure protein [Virgibacillus pantothenticus]
MIGDVLVKIGADISDYQQKLSKAGNAMESFGNNMSQLGSTMTTTFGAIAVASAAGVGFAVKQASDFESAFAGVRKTVDATETEYASLSKEIRNMAKEIPASASEIAKVAEIAGQLGIEKKHLMDFTRTMVDLGVSTNMSAEEAATALARFANITGMSMSDVDRLGSTIVALGNNLATTESEITNMSLRLAGAGNQIGLTEAEIMSFAAALSSVGIEAEMGGSAFSRVMLNMNTAVMDGSENLDRFAKVAGMSAGEFATAFEKDAAGAILAFIKGLGKMSDEGANTTQILDELGLGEIRVRDSLMRAAGASDVFSKSLKIGNKAWEENTALTKEAQERYKTFASKMQVLKNRFNNIMILVGGPFMDALSGIIDALDPVISAIERLAEWFANASKPVQQFITTFVLLIPVLATIGVAIGGFLMLVGTVTAAVAGATAIFGGLGAAIVFTAKIVGIAVGAFVGLAGAVAFAITTVKNFDKVLVGLSNAAKFVRDSFVALFDYVAENAAKFAESVIQSVERISPAFAKFLSDSWGRLGRFLSFMEEVFATAGEIVTGFVGVISDFSLGVFETVLLGLDKVARLVGDGLNYLKESGITLGDVFRNLAGPITSLIIILGGFAGPIGWILSALTFLVTRTNLVSDSIKAFKGEMEFSEVIRNVGDMTASFVTNLAEMITKAVEVGSDLVVKLIEGISKQIPNITKVAVKIVTTLIEGLVKGITTIADTASVVIPTVVDAILESIPLLIDLGIVIINSLVEAIINALPVLIDAALAIVTTLVDSIVVVLPMILEIGLLIISTLIDAVLTALPALFEIGLTIIITLVNAIAESLPVLVETGFTILTTLIQGLIEALPNILEAAILLITTLVNALIELIPAIIDAGIQIVLALVDGIIQILPALIDAALQIILALVTALIDNLPKIIDAGIEILLALVDGIIDMLPALIDAALTLIIELAAALIDNLPKIIDAGVEILFALIDGIMDVLPKLVEAAYTLVVELVGALLEKLPDLFDAGVDLLNEFIDGLLDDLGDVADAAVKIGDEIISNLPVVGDLYDLGKNLIAGLNDGMESMQRKTEEKALEIGLLIDKTLKKFHKMRSPSRKMRDEVGAMLGKGIIVGMDAEMTNIQRAAQRMAEAATPEQPKLAGFDTSNLRNYTRQATSRLQAEMQASGTFEADREQHVLLAEIRDELRRQKQMIIKLNEREVGRAIEPTVTNMQKRKNYTKSQMKL